MLPLRRPPSGPIDALQRALAAENLHGIEQPQADGFARQGDPQRVDEVADLLALAGDEFLRELLQRLGLKRIDRG